MAFWRLKKQLREKRERRAGCFEYMGRQVFFPPGSALYSQFREDGHFEAPVRRALVGFARENSVIFDVGANIGLMAIPILRDRKSATVISLEASPTAFAQLVKTREHLPEKDRWTVFDKAAADRDGTITFHECVDGNDAYSGMKDTGRGGSSRPVTVEAVTLDRLWNEFKTPSVSVIKVDVEGAELSVLRGAVECISNTRPAIVMEWWPENFTAYGAVAGDLFDFASDNRYRVYEITTLNRVADPGSLHLFHTLKMEDFLLLPEEAGQRAAPKHRSMHAGSETSLA